MRARFHLSLAAVSIIVAAAPALAAGINFSWDACTPEGGAQGKTFACNTNSGSRSAWASFVLDADESTFVGIEAVVDVQTDADSLPSWWMLYNAGSCRQTALTTSFDFTSAPATSCTNAWGGQAQGGIAAYQTYWTTPQVAGGNPNTARIKIVGAVPSNSPLILAANTEYYGFRVTISNAETVGSAACGGCDVPACLTLYSITTDEINGPRTTLTAPITDTVVHWQSSSGSCPGAQIPPPQRWGQVRSLLR